MTIFRWHSTDLHQDFHFNEHLRCFYGHHKQTPAFPSHVPPRKHNLLKILFALYRNCIEWKFNNLCDALGHARSPPTKVFWQRLPDASARNREKKVFFLRYLVKLLSLKTKLYQFVFWQSEIPEPNHPMCIVVRSR